MTTWLKRVTFAISLLVAATPAFASLADIDTSKLPQTAAVKQAYSDALAIEPMVEQWSSNWSYPTPKQDVVSHLNADLSALETAAQSAPDNEEILLLTGTVAHYAYNVDVASASQVAIDSFEKAEKLAPNDYRPGWFLGTHQCQSADVVGGMNAFLDVEQKFPQKSLPVDFWDDYVFCTGVSNMPAHALRAAAYLKSVNAPDSPTVDTVVTAAQSRIQPLDLSSTIPAANIWQSDPAGTNAVLTNFAFGFAFTIPGTWQMKLSDVAQGTTIAQIGTGPYQATTSQLYPTILIVSRQAKSGEALSDFANQFLHASPFKSVSAANCPFKGCLVFEAVSPGTYGANGDGDAFAEVFEGDAPEFTGLLLERPEGPPTSTAGGSQPTFYRPPTRLARASGTLYYLVMLDTAGSILPQAQADYAAFLKSLQVEGAN
ncbi:MAG: hypothetical protein WBF06_08805 [Candidatus Acidiferrales bacterium]